MRAQVIIPACNLGGNLYGEPVVFIGGRDGDKELLEIKYQDGQYKTGTIERGYGARNIHMSEHNMLIANREAGEYAIFEIVE